MGSGAAPLVLESLLGCQYRMTSYDVADRSDLDPAYGLHLHDPRLLEYVGAPESARLLSRAVEYMMHRWGGGGGGGGVDNKMFNMTYL